MPKSTIKISSNSREKVAEEIVGKLTRIKTRADIEDTDDVGIDDGGRKVFLESLANGLRCLSLFGQDTTSLTIQEAASSLELTRPAARRILLTLTSLGFLEQVERDFLITPKVLELGFTYFSTQGLRGIAIPYMEAVAARTGETCALAVLDGDDIVFLHRSEAKKMMRLDLTVGSRLPAYAHSMGRVLLSGLSDEKLEHYLQSVKLKSFTPATIVEPNALRQEIMRARELGWYFSNGELMDGIAGISRPIFDSKGKIVAAINISMILGNRTLEYVVQEMLPHLSHASEAISRIHRAVQ
jgi:IclR family pca regulon transcriptional regulator